MRNKIKPITTLTHAPVAERTIRTSAVSESTTLQEPMVEGAPEVLRSTGDPSKATQVVKYLSEPKTTAERDVGQINAEIHSTSPECTPQLEACQTTHTKCTYTPHDT